MKKKRRTCKLLRTEISELDYLAKLSEEEKEYLIQFMYEYYQADFNFEHPIHKTKEHIKDSRDRNNASKRQAHMLYYGVGGIPYVKED